MKKILVLVRETFPTNEILTDKNLREKRVLNPYDEYALFQAKKIKEKTETEITCLRSEEHTSELQSRQYLVCRLLLEKKKIKDASELKTLKTTLRILNVKANVNQASIDDESIRIRVYRVFKYNLDTVTSKRVTST